MCVSQSVSVLQLRVSHHVSMLHQCVSHQFTMPLVPRHASPCLSCHVSQLPVSRHASPCHSCLCLTMPVRVSAVSCLTMPLHVSLSHQPLCYSCIGYNDIAGQQRKSGQGVLTVTSPETEPRRPVLISEPPPERSEVRANYSLMVPCVADGYPLPDVRWTRDDGEWGGGGGGWRDGRCG